MRTARVYAGFQILDDANRLRLTSQRTFRDLESQGIQLYEDLPLIVYTDDANDDGERDDLAAGFSFHGGARPHQPPVRRR